MTSLTSFGIHFGPAVDDDGQVLTAGSGGGRPMILMIFFVSVFATPRQHSLQQILRRLRPAAILY
jgi:hypothetical protein